MSKLALAGENKTTSPRSSNLTEPNPLFVLSYHTYESPNSYFDFLILVLPHQKSYQKFDQLEVILLLFLQSFLQVVHNPIFYHNHQQLIQSFRQKHLNLIRF